MSVLVLWGCADPQDTGIVDPPAGQTPAPAPPAPPAPAEPIPPPPAPPPAAPGAPEIIAPDAAADARSADTGSPTARADGGATGPTAPPNMLPVLTAIAAGITASSPGTNSALGVVWLPTAARTMINGTRLVEPASSPKWIWAMAALHVKAIAQVEPAALPTFRTSDNAAAGTLIDLAGGPNAVNDFSSKTLGIPIDLVSLCRWSTGRARVATNCSGARGGRNLFSVSGGLSFLEHAWKRTAVGSEKGDKLLEWAKLAPRTGTGGWLGGQLPAAARASMHHKAGWLPAGCCGSDATLNNMNEIGIVETPRGHYGVVILLGQGADYWGKQRTAMEWASCVIWHAYAMDGADPFKAPGCIAP